MRRLATFVIFASLLTLAAITSVTAAAPDSDQSGTVILKDGHRQIFPLANVTRIELFSRCLPT